ncbi:MAG: hypothetical protein AAFY42_05165 [Pseudomonadota bacterium]
MRIERLVGWIAHDLKRGGHWGQVAGVIAIVAFLLTTEAMALFWPLGAELALPTDVSGNQVTVNVPRVLHEGAEPSALAVRVRMYCARVEAKRMSGTRTITFSSKEILACDDDQQPVAHLRTEFSIWDLAKIEMSRSASNSVRE